VSGGTRRKGLLDTFPLLVKAKIFGKCRRRRRSRAGSFHRIFGFIFFVLAVLCLGGFRRSRDRNILNRSSLWERRARNKGLVILEGKQVESYKKNSDKKKRRRTNEDSVYTAGKGRSKSKKLAAKAGIS
jgi:hypothetical protein